MAWHKVQNLPFNFLLGPPLVGLLKPDTFFLSSFISIEFLTWHTFLFSFAHKITETSFFPSLFYHAIPFSRAPPPNPHTHMHTNTLTHSLFKKSWCRCQECVCCPFDTESDAIFGAMGRAEPRDVAFVYSTATLSHIFIMALLWASRQGTSPASSHSFALHQDSIIISPLTLAGSSCPKPSTINGAQYISPLSLQPSHAWVLVQFPNPDSDARRDTGKFLLFSDMSSLHKLDSLLGLACYPHSSAPPFVSSSKQGVLLLT